MNPGRSKWSMNWPRNSRVIIGYTGENKGVCWAKIYDDEAGRKISIDFESRTLELQGFTNDFDVHSGVVAHQAEPALEAQSGSPSNSLIDLRNHIFTCGRHNPETNEYMCSVAAPEQHFVFFGSWDGDLRVSYRKKLFGQSVLVRVQINEENAHSWLEIARMAERS